MDPTNTLDNLSVTIRKIAKQLRSIKLVNPGVAVPLSLSGLEILEMVENFESLNKHLSSGGEFPKQWSR